MNDFVERMIKERIELSEKIARLGNFTRGDVFPSLSYANQHLLYEQLEVMEKYRDILAVRIELNTSKGVE